MAFDHCKFTACPFLRVHDCTIFTYPVSSAHKKKFYSDYLSLLGYTCIPHQCSPSSKIIKVLVVKTVLCCIRLSNIKTLSRGVSLTGTEKNIDIKPRPE
mmetsp:Transcript_66407/g.117903  ORF Transcript_66407/g.117903 Transcript_66407/m.117903 type:complete len:99 (+) Transcript_66407:64-360(+)